MAAGATSTGGVTALLVKKLSPKSGLKKLHNEKSKKEI
jgi:hypothetical protein